MTFSQGECAIPQLLVGPPTQVPSSHSSPIVQNLPSSQAVPFGDATTMHVLRAPSSCPVLHTLTLHGGVSNFEQSTPHGPGSPPPVPLAELELELELELSALLSVSRPPTQEQPLVQATESKSKY